MKARTSAKDPAAMYRAAEGALQRLASAGGRAQTLL